MWPEASRIRVFMPFPGVEVPHRPTERRPGDVAETWADVTKAGRELGWEARRGIEEMCADAWRWQQYALEL